MGRTAQGVALLVAASVALVGCASAGTSSSSSSSSGQQSASQTGSLSSCVTAADRAEQSGQGPTKPNYPTTPVDVAKAKGKTIWMIQNSTTPLVTDVTTAFQQAGSVAGVQTKVIDGDGLISNMVSGVSEAVAQHAAAIVLFAVALSTVAPQVEAAKAAGIPVVDTFNGDDGQNLTAQGVVSHVSEDPKAAGGMVADWMLADTNCKLDAADLGASVVTPHELSREGAQAQVAALCSSCKFQFVNLDLTTMSTSAGPQAQETVRRNPGINILMSSFDGAVPFILSGLQQSGTTNVKIISMDGTQPEITMIRSHTSPVVADVALPPVSYIGWAYMDQALRAVTGATPFNGILPFRLVDDSNVGPAGTNLFPLFAGYQAAFEKLWGVTG